MTRTNMKFAIVLIVILSNTELKLSRTQLFPQALKNYFFPKDPGIIRVRTMDEIKTGKGVRILDFIGLVERHGYPAEEHYVTTEDGYNLIIHRIPDSPLSDNTENKKVVFLQHGIISSSDNWVLFGAGKDLVFLLADQGYDVWLGNIRGNTYSRSHVTLSPRNADFWQFSYHEPATIDLPRMIDYVLDYTGKKALHYIGHSMGTTLLYALLSSRPEYNAKIRLGMCLAPIVFWKDMPFIVKKAVDIGPKIMEFTANNDIYEIFPLSSSSILLAKKWCAVNAKTQPICAAIEFLISGYDPVLLNTTALPEIFTYYPAGTSTLTLYHFYQNIVTQDFRRYDSGYSIYNGHLTSKRYELEKINAPLVFIYSVNDALATKRNVLELYKRLSSVILLEQIPYKLFNHLDFLWAINAKSLLYDRVINIMEEFEAKQSTWNLFSAILNRFLRF